MSNKRWTTFKEMMMASFSASLEFLKRFWWGVFIFFLGGFGSAKTFFSTFIENKGYTLTEIGIFLGVVFLGIWFIIFLCYFVIQLWRRASLYIKESVYGNAIGLLSEGFAKIHSLKKKDNVTVQELKTMLIAFCDSIKKIYDYKTQSKCSVTIQVFTDNYTTIATMPRMTQVQNLVRDSEATRSRNSQAYHDTNHHIDNNTCYQRIISNFLSDRKEELFFLSNDLPADNNYENSSFLSRGQLSDEAKKDIKQRRKEWNLGYTSELVVALSPIHLDDVAEMPILGFICVDCPLDRKDIFNEKYDVPLLKGVADGVYDLVREYFFKEEPPVVLDDEEPPEEEDDT